MPGCPSCPLQVAGHLIGWSLPTPPPPPPRIWKREESPAMLSLFPVHWGSSPGSTLPDLSSGDGVAFPFPPQVSSAVNFSPIVQKSAFPPPDSRELTLWRILLSPSPGDRNTAALFLPGISDLKGIQREIKQGMLFKILTPFHLQHACSYHYGNR